VRRRRMRGVALDVEENFERIAIDEKPRLPHGSRGQQNVFQEISAIQAILTRSFPTSLKASDSSTEQNGS